MGKVSMFLPMVIVGRVHSKKVELMARGLILLMGNLFRIIILIICCMGMQLKRNKLNHRPIYIRVNLELAKNVDMGFLLLMVN